MTQSAGNKQANRAQHGTKGTVQQLSQVRQADRVKSLSETKGKLASSARVRKFSCGVHSVKGHILLCSGYTGCTGAD